MALARRERMLTAMRLGQADCVPVCPDISNMIPCRLTGRPFWDVYLNERPSLYEAYREAVDYFGLDGWWTDYFSVARPRLRGAPTWRALPVEERDGRLVRRSVLETPAGTLTQETTYYAADSPTATEKPIKGLRASRALWPYLFPEVEGLDGTAFEIQRRDFGERGIYGLWIPAPGFNLFFDWIEDGLDECTFAYYDDKAILDEFAAVVTRHYLALLERVLDLAPDFILTGGSGGFTLGSPSLWREYALPMVQTVTRRARERGIVTMLHSCGRQAEMVKWCAEETDLSCINPLEPPPMGDCDLGALKRAYGDRLCLMGNLHTTDVMLRGSVETVDRAARAAIDAAAAGGGFILSTGDQCGRDTPFENLFRLVEVARTYGRYA